MQMGKTSNPRKLYNSGGTTVVSIPKSVKQAVNVGEGDRVVFEYEDGQARLKPVKWTVSDDE